LAFKPAYRLAAGSTLTADRMWIGSFIHSFILLILKQLTDLT